MMPAWEWLRHINKSEYPEHQVAACQREAIEACARIVKEMAKSEREKTPNDRMGDGSPLVLLAAVEAIRALLPKEV